MKTTHPVKLLDSWIEKHNCAIEYFAGNPYYPWSQVYRPAINILSDVIDFFNGVDPGALAQSGSSKRPITARS